MKKLLALLIFLPSMFLLSKKECGATLLSDIATEDIDSGQLNEKLRFLSTGKLDIKPRRIACHDDGFINFDSDTLVIDCTNNRIGIGIESPDGTLHIHSASAGSITADTDADDLVIEGSGNTGLTILSGNASNAKIFFGDDGDANAGQILYANNSGEDIMAFFTSGSEKLRITSAGDVGIGITTPEGLLHLFTSDASTVASVDADELILESNATTGLSIFSGASSLGKIFFGDSGDNDIGQITYDHAANGFGFFTNATQKMTITSAGKVGIGIIIPDGTTHIQTVTAGSVDTAADADELTLENDNQVGMTFLSPNDKQASIFFGDPQDNNIGQIVYDHSSESLAFVVNTVFALGIDSSQQLHIQPSGTANVELEVSNGVTTGGGTIHRAASGTHSARELKSDIVHLSQASHTRAYNDVKALRPVRFRYKVRNSSGTLIRDTNQSIHYGYILDEAPDSIIKGEAIIIDDRILNLEMTVKELIKMVETLQGQ